MDKLQNGVILHNRVANNFKHKEVKMKDLSNFCIGSQCENICKELTNFQNGENVDENTIDSSLEILSFCLNICDNSKIKQLTFQPANEQFLPFIMKLYQNKKNQEIKNSFIAVLEAINLVKQNKTGDVSSAIKFFHDISDICLEDSMYSDHATVLA